MFTFLVVVLLAVVVGTTVVIRARGDLALPERAGRSGPSLRTRRPPASRPPTTAGPAEGTYAELAVAPWWRKVLSALGLCLIVALLGVGLAVVAGALAAGLAELLDSTVS